METPKLPLVLIKMAEETKQEAPKTETDAGPQSSGVLGALLGAVESAANTARKFDEQYKVTEQAVGLVKAAENKAKEIDEQYKISEQSKVVIDAGLQKAKEVDESLQISATTKQIVGEVAKQVKSVDDQLQISNTVKSTIETVDEKAGISKKFKEVDSQYQLTDKVQGVMGAAKNAVLGNASFSGNCIANGVKTEISIMFGDQRKTAHVFLKDENGEMKLPILLSSVAESGEGNQVSLKEPVPQTFTFETEGEVKEFLVAFSATQNALPKPVEDEKKEVEGVPESS